MRFIKDALQAVKDFVTTVKFEIDGSIKTSTYRHSADAVVLFPGATEVATAATTTGSGADIDVSRYIGCEICLDVTAASGTFNAGEGLRVKVVGIDEITGKTKVLFDSYTVAGDYITTTGTWFLSIDNLWFRTIRVEWEILNGAVDASFTFSVSGQFKA